MSIKLSVIVPFYNSEKTIESCLKSIINQTFKNFEIILVNDGSTDEGLAICENIKSENDNLSIIIISKENTGAQDSRNRGLQIARGDYITFIDADDWIEENYFEKVFAKIDNNDLLAVGFKREINGDVLDVENPIASGEYNVQENGNCFFSKILFTGNYYEAGIIPSNWSKFIKREIAIKVFPSINMNIRMGEDAVCTCAALTICKSVKILNDIKSYHYIEYNNSVSHSFDALYFQRIDYIYSDLTKFFNNSIYSEILCEQLQYYIVFLFQIGLGQFSSYMKRGKLLTRINMFFRISKDIENLKIPELLLDKKKVDNKTYKMANFINSRSLIKLLINNYMG